VCNRRGKTALFYAKNPKMLYLLLEYGADPTAGSSQGRSLLEEFVLKNPENARALLDYEVSDFLMSVCLIVGIADLHS